MFATLLSLAFALVVFFFPLPLNAQVPWDSIALTMIALAIVVLIIQSLIPCYTWGPLQKSDKSLAPRVVDMYRGDRQLRILNTILYLFPIATLIVALVLVAVQYNHKMDLIAGWTVAFGVAIDILHHLYKRTLSYFNPFDVVKMFTQEAKASVQNEREMDLCDWIDALSEVAIKATQRSSTSLATEALEAQQQTARRFLEASKSISHHAQDSQTQQFGITDKVSFTLFYLLQRLEFVHQKAVECRLEPICSKVITSFGKISLNAAKYDITLASYPLVYLGKCATQAQEKGLPDVGVKALLTLQEVAKTFPQEIDIKYLELKDTYLTLITQMHEISKEAFKQDKSINLSLLTQPFKEMKEFFSAEPLSQHQDTPAIIDGINQVLAEFSALEMVLKTLPPISNIATELSQEESKA